MTTTPTICRSISYCPTIWIFTTTIYIFWEMFSVIVSTRHRKWSCSESRGSATKASCSNREATLSYTLSSPKIRRRQKRHLYLSREVFGKLRTNISFWHTTHLSEPNTIIWSGHRFFSAKCNKTKIIWNRQLVF